MTGPDRRNPDSTVPPPRSSLRPPDRGAGSGSSVPISGERPLPAWDVFDENQRLRQLLEESEHLRALGELSGCLAHEVNNPVAYIHLAAERLAQRLSAEPGAAAGYADDAREIVDTCRRIMRITRGLQALGRRGDDLPFEAAWLQQVVTDTVALCRARFGVLGVELRVEPIQDDLVCECTPVQVSQILVALLNNAADAAAQTAERWTSLSVRRHLDSVQLVVCDSGGGIPAAQREQLFVPFRTTKPVGKGVGLGLSTAKKLAERHNGTLDLDVRAPHTTFVLWLPLAQPASGPMP